MEATIWTDELVNRLITLWNEGLTARGIAEILTRESGKVVTRNSVIGKSNRLDLPMRKISRKLTDAERHERRVQASRRYRRKRMEAAIASGEIVKPRGRGIPVDDQQIPFAQRKTTFDLDNHTCRWPVGDPKDAEFFFCGGPSDLAGGRPYCVDHTFRSMRGA